MTLPIDPTGLILAATTLLGLTLYLREYNLRKKREIQKDQFLENIKEKGWETLHQSIKKSQNMLGEAELEGIKVISDTRFYTQKMEQEYSKKLSQIIQEAENSIKTYQTQLIQTSSTMVEERINKLFDSLEQRLSDFLVETSQKTSSSIELELKAARALIDSYKEERLKLIDENILAMMEQTLAVVLNKKLSLEDQLDLVYEALEKAKVEKFIV